MPCRVEFPDPFDGEIEGMEFRIDAKFPHPARNELGILGTVVQDEDTFGVGHGIIYLNRGYGTIDYCQWPVVH